MIFKGPFQPQMFYYSVIHTMQLPGERGQQPRCVSPQALGQQGQGCGTPAHILLPTASVRKAVFSLSADVSCDFAQLVTVLTVGWGKAPLNKKGTK